MIPVEYKDLAGLDLGRLLTIYDTVDGPINVFEHGRVLATRHGLMYEPEPSPPPVEEPAQVVEPAAHVTASAATWSGELLEFAPPPGQPRDWHGKWIAKGGVGGPGGAPGGDINAGPIGTPEPGIDEAYKPYIDKYGPERDPAANAREAMILALEPDDGGFTIDPRDGSTPEHGFAVAVRGHSSITPQDEFFKPEVGQKVIEDWLTENAEFFKAHPEAKVGGWHDGKNREIVLDPALVIEDRAEAIRMGREQNQQAIADLAAIHEGDWDNAFINTGGTGDREQIAAAVGWEHHGREDDDTPRDRGPPEARGGDDARGAEGLREGGLREDRRDAQAAVTSGLTIEFAPPPGQPRDWHGKWIAKGAGTGGLPPQLPGESVFDYQGRMVAGMAPDEAHELLFKVRERYPAVPYIQDGAKRWRKDHGLPDPAVDPAEIPAPRAKAEIVAEHFEKTPDQSDDPKVQAAFADFKRQNAEMFDYMTRPESEGGMGVKVDFAPNEKGDPYPSATAQAEDLRQNHHITIQSGLGGQHSKTMTTEEYDHFRAVHDTFGHAGVGGGFDRHGEYEAYLEHSSMYTGEGRKAMASEYHGVNTALWAGGKGTPGTGKSIIFPDSLIPNPWNADGEYVAA